MQNGSDLVNSLYKQNDYYDREEEDTTKRGLLDRVLSPIQNTSITSALYNVTDDDPDTTFLGGIGAGLSRQLNPFKDDVSDTHYAADVINNVFNDGEDPDTFLGKVGTTVGGFVGDVVLDPMSYVSGLVSAPVKLLKGSGKSADVLSAAEKLKGDIPVNRNITLADAKEVIKTRYNKVDGIETVVDTLAKKLYDDFNKSVDGVVSEQQIRQGKGITVGICNLPFGNKFDKLLKRNKIFETQVASENNIRKFGDNTVSPTFNRILKEVRKSKVGQAFSDYNKLLAKKEDGDVIGALNEFAAINEMKAVKSAAATGIKSVNKIVNNLNGLNKDTLDVLNNAYVNGDLDTVKTLYEVKLNILSNASKAKNLDDDIIRGYDEQRKIIKQSLDNINEIRDEISRKKKYAMSNRSVDQYDEAKTIYKREKVDGIDDYQFDEKSFDDYDVKSSLEKPFGADEAAFDNFTPDDILDEDVTAALYRWEDDGTLNGITKRVDDLYASLYPTKSNFKTTVKTNEIKDEAFSKYYKKRRAEIVKELKNNKDFPSNTKRLQEELNKLEAKRDKLVNNSPVDIQNTKISYTEKLQDLESEHPEEYRKLLDDIKNNETEEMAFNIGERSKELEIFESKPILDRQSIENSGEVEEFIDEIIKEKGAEALPTGKSYDLETTQKMRDKFNELVNAKVTSYGYNEKTKSYSDKKVTGVFNDANFTPEVAYTVDSLIKSGKKAQAAIMLNDISAYSSMDKIAHSHISSKVASTELGKQLAEKAQIPKLEFTSPNFYRVNHKDISVNTSDGLDSIHHSNALFHSWSEVKDIIKNNRLNDVAPDGRTYGEILERMSSKMTPNVRRLADGSLPSNYTGTSKTFIVDNIDDLVKLDEENAKEFTRANRVNKGNWEKIEDRAQTPRLSEVETAEPNLDSKTNSVSSAKKTFTEKNENTSWTHELDGSSRQEKEYASTGNKVRNGTDLGSGVVRDVKSIRTVYDSESASWILANKADIFEFRRNCMLSLEKSLAEAEKGSKAYNDIFYQLEQLKKADDIDELADTPFMDKMLEIKDFLDDTNPFGLRGKYCSAEAKAANGLFELLEVAMKENGFDIQEVFKADTSGVFNNEFVEGVQKAAYDKKYASGNGITIDEDLLNSKQTLNKDVFKKADATDKNAKEFTRVNRANLLEDYYFKRMLFGHLKQTLNKDVAQSTAKNVLDDYYFKRMLFGDLKYDEDLLNSKQTLNKSVAQSTAKNLEDYYFKRMLFGHSKQTLNKSVYQSAAKNLKAKLSELNYKGKDGTVNKLSAAPLDDLLHIARRTAYNKKARYFGELDELDGKQLYDVFKKADATDKKVLEDYYFKRMLFGDLKYKDINDPEVLNVVMRKLNSTVDSLKNSLDDIEGFSIDTISDLNEAAKMNLLADLQASNMVGVSYDKFSKTMEALKQYNGDLFQDLEKANANIDFFTDRLGIRPQVKSRTANNFEKDPIMKFIKSIPLRRTEEAEAFLQSYKGTTKDLWNDVIGLDAKSANEIMKKRTGVEQFYNDDLADMLVGYSMSTGKRLQRSGNMNMILHNFANPYKVGALKDNEVIVVKTAALKNYVKKYQYEILPDKRQNVILTGLINDGVSENSLKYNTMFTELTEEQYNKIAQENMTIDGKKPNRLSAWAMDKDNFQKFNEAADYQNREAEGSFWKIFDRVQGMWKTANTVINPGFHVNNAVSNAANSFFYSGAAAFNPSKIKIARTVVKNGDPKQSIYIQGKAYTYKQLNAIMKQSGVIESNFFAKDVNDVKSYAFLPIVKQGLQLGNEIEQTQRAAIFIEALVNGETVENAGNIVNKFLFDYGDLTDIEKKYFKRAIPFYTFMRKNVPLQLEQMLNSPEIFRNLTKGLNNFERLAGDGYVPDDERNEWRQEYVELPFKVGGSNFGINLNLPYQQLDRLEPRKIAGQMSPAIKALIELATGEYLYTGMDINSAGEYAASQLTPARIADVSDKKYGVDRTLYPIGQVGGMPLATIKEKR